jgi:nucleotide-binding universal stress UspA family protein
MFNRILVPLDGSSLAERAIPHAEEFSRIFGANIILLQVLEPTSFHENPKAVDPLSWQIHKAEVELYMQRISIKIRENLGENVTTDFDVNKSRVSYAIREGKTSENIVTFAHSENIDLLVISTHGSGGLTRWNMSSVTQKVINMIYLPVLIVRAYNKPMTGSNKLHYRSILLPIDSSRRAESALSAGVALARGDISIGLDSSVNASKQQNLPTEPFVKTKLILVAVIKPPEIPIPEPYPVEIEKLSQELMQVSRMAVGNYLYEMKERLPVMCESRVLENISVTSALQELASYDEEIDLVVLCAHGYTGKNAWPYGSVARNYIEHGTKSVLVIQDISYSNVPPSAAEIAAEKSGDR